MKSASCGEIVMVIGVSENEGVVQSAYSRTPHHYASWLRMKLPVSLLRRTAEHGGGMSHHCWTWAILCAQCGWLGGAAAQSYPSKPVRILTSAPGGASDRVSRLVGQALSGPLGQQVIIDNRPGIISIETAAKSSPDGYTLLVSSNLVWILPMMQQVRYDPIKSFVPVILAARAPNVVVVHPSMPVQSLPQLIALAKSKPGELNYSAGSIGSTPHLTGEMFKSRTGAALTHIAYKGAGPALTALIAGEVHVSFPGAGSAMPHVKSKRLRALAVTSARPSELLPGVPTISSTVPGFETVALYGVFAPAGTPSDIIARLNRDAEATLNAGTIKQMLLESGLEPVRNSPEQFAAMIKTDTLDMQKVVAEIAPPAR